MGGAQGPVLSPACEQAPGLKGLPPRTQHRWVGRGNREGRTLRRGLQHSSAALAPMVGGGAQEGEVTQRPGQ